MQLKKLCLFGVGFRTASAAVREAFRVQSEQTAASTTETDLCAP
jgi:hypothetical protein